MKTKITDVLSKSLSSIDLFPRNLFMTFHKKEGYHTSLGGAFSLLVYIATFYYLVFSIIKMVSKSELSTTKNEIYANLNTDMALHNITEEGIDFAVAIR